MAVFDQSGQTVGSQVGVGDAALNSTQAGEGITWKVWEPEPYGQYDVTPDKLDWLRQHKQLLIVVGDSTVIVEMSMQEDGND